jgi:hypothetical protein
MQSTITCCSSGVSMGEACQPTYAVTPMIHLKKEARSCLSSLSLRNVIMWDNNTSLAENKHRTFNRLYRSYGYQYIIYTLQYLNVFLWQFHICLNSAYINWKQALKQAPNIYLMWAWAMQIGWDHQSIYSNGVSYMVCSPKMKESPVLVYTFSV